MADEVMADDVETQAPEAADASVDTGSPVEQQDVGGDPSPQQAAPAEQNYYAAFRTLPQFRGFDDQQIATHLYETMQREQSQARALQQYQQLIPVASEYYSNRDQYNQWKAAQKAGAVQPQAAPAQQAKPDSWWNPPKIKDGYRQYLTRDAEGREVVADHAPLEAKAQLQEWMAYRADFARKFLDNPEEALGPMVQNIAERRAAELVEKQVTLQRREQFVKDIEDQNKGWLYENPETRMASREGLIVQKYIEDAKAMGVTDPESRWNISVAMLERDLALQVLQQMVDQQQQGQPAQQPTPSQPAPPPVNPAAEQAQKNMEYLRSQATRTAPRNSPATTDPRVPQRPLTFAEKLKAQLQAEGISGLE
jgi:hypothetical protein